MESREPYEDLLRKIDRLGPIKDIVNDAVTINQIISYDGDRHLLCAFFDRVNDALEKGELRDEDLAYLRSGRMMDSIVNLDQTVAQHASRQAFTSERLDKVNYVSLLKDNQTLAVSYTHPTIIDALCGEASYDRAPRDLTWFKTCGTYSSLPSSVQSVIASSVLAKGDVAAVQSLLSQSSLNLASYEKVNNSKKDDFDGKSM